MNSKNKIKLLNLIEKYQEGKATEQEIEYLSNFFVSHQKSKEWPFDNKLKKVIKASIFDKITSEIKNSSKKEAKVKKLNFKNLIKYAAAIIVLVSVTYFITEKSAISEKTIIVNNNVEIGTDKATLTLENGTNIALEKGKVFNSKTINSNGEKIIYNSNSETTSKKIAYNYLTIPRGGEFYIELEDNTKVWLNSESQLKYPVAFAEGKTREVELVYGEAYFEVSPSTQHNGDKFKVHTQQQTIEVLGTEFNVKAYKKTPEIYTTLAEGKVKVEVNGVTEMLKPSQQTTYNKTTKSINVATVDVSYETAWRTGYFNFTNKPFIEVTEVLARWYNVEFHFENKALEQFKINGVISKNQNVEYFLFTLKNIENINYSIKDKHIYIK